MTNAIQNDDARELNIDGLEDVSGGMSFVREVIATVLWSGGGEDNPT
jgi:hypothetical protein